jgi:hypothetical protein
MFEKVPYGVKVRVRGNEQDGFIAEYALHTSRFFPLFDSWSVIRNYPSANPALPLNTFATFLAAKEAAMREYNSWIDFYKRREETKRITKAQRNVVWKHP